MFTIRAWCFTAGSDYSIVPRPCSRAGPASIATPCSGRNGCTANSTRLCALFHVPCRAGSPQKAGRQLLLGPEPPSCCAPPFPPRAGGAKKNYLDVIFPALSGVIRGRKRHWGGVKKNVPRRPKRQYRGARKIRWLASPTPWVKKNLRQDSGRKKNHGGRKN